MVTRQQVSAGGIVCRRRQDGTVEVALIATHATTGGGSSPSGTGEIRWGLPKGLVAPGESHESAALREVREETGLRAAIAEPLRPIEYWYWGQEGGERVRYHKRVYFYLMAWQGGSLTDHDWEVDDAAWFPLEEAIRIAAFRTEREVLAAAKEMAGKIEAEPGDRRGVG